MINSLFLHFHICLDLYRALTDISLITAGHRVPGCNKSPLNLSTLLPDPTLQIARRREPHILSPVLLLTLESLPPSSTYRCRLWKSDKLRFFFLSFFDFKQKNRDGVFHGVGARVVGRAMEKNDGGGVCVVGGGADLSEMGSWDIFQLLVPYSLQSHRAGEAKSSSFISIRGLFPLPCSPPPLAPLQQPCNAHKIILIEFVSLQMKWIVKDKIT